jgi:hypothetical protein
MPTLYPLIERGTRSALTGVGHTFDPVMTETLR